MLLLPGHSTDSLRHASYLTIALVTKKKGKSSEEKLFVAVKEGILLNSSNMAALVRWIEKDKTSLLTVYRERSHPLLKLSKISF